MLCSLNIVLYQFAALTPIFQQCSQERKLNEFVRRAIPIILGICRDSMGDEFGLPIISPGAQDAMQLMDQRLQAALGAASLGLARWIVGTPPPALILDLLMKPEYIGGIYPQGPVGKHDYLLKFRSGYAAEKCSWTL